MFIICMLYVVWRHFQTLSPDAVLSLRNKSGLACGRSVKRVSQAYLLTGRVLTANKISDRLEMRKLEDLSLIFNLSRSQLSITMFYVLNYIRVM